MVCSFIFPLMIKLLDKISQVFQKSTMKKQLYLHGAFSSIYSTIGVSELPSHISPLLSVQLSL